MSYHVRLLLALALAFGFAWGARAQDAGGATLSISGSGASTYTGLTKVGTGTLDLTSGTLNEAGLTTSPWSSGGVLTVYTSPTLSANTSSAQTVTGGTLTLANPVLGTLSLGTSTLSAGTITLAGAWPVLTSTGGYFPLSTIVVTPSTASGAVQGAAAPVLYSEPVSFSLIDPPAAVPEPSALAMALVAAVGFLVLRRRAQLGR